MEYLHSIINKERKKLRQQNRKGCYIIRMNTGDKLNVIDIIGYIQEYIIIVAYG